MWLETWTSPLFWESFSFEWQERPEPFPGRSFTPWWSRMPAGVCPPSLKRRNCCICISCLPHPPIHSHMTLLVHHLCSDGFMRKGKIAATWGWEGDKKQTVVKRLCRGLGSALLGGNGEETQVEAQKNWAAKTWAGQCSNPGACMQTSLFIIQ